MDGVRQFIFSEGKIVTNTLLENVYCLGVGQSLAIDETSYGVQPYYYHTPPLLSSEDYLEEVRKYFTALRGNEGVVATELSAGFDTRLVAACAATNVPNIRGIANTNQADGGVDQGVSQLLADQLGMPYSLIPHEPSAEVPTEIDIIRLLHGTGGAEK